MGPPCRGAQVNRGWLVCGVLSAGRGGVGLRMVCQGMGGGVEGTLHKGPALSEAQRQASVHGVLLCLAYIYVAHRLIAV